MRLPVSLVVLEIFTFTNLLATVYPFESSKRCAVYSARVIELHSRQVMVCAFSIFAAVQSLQSCPTLGDPINCSPRGSSVHRVSQAGILEWIAISFLADLPNPGIEPVSHALAGKFFTTEPPGKPLSPSYLKRKLDIEFGTFSPPLSN